MTVIRLDVKQVGEFYRVGYSSNTMMSEAVTATTT